MTDYYELIAINACDWTLDDILEAKEAIQSLQAENTRLEADLKAMAEVVSLLGDLERMA